MRKKILVFLVTITLFTGCFYKNKDSVEKFINKIEKSNSYYLNGSLEIINNEDKYSYDVNVSYKKNDKFRVSLKNKSNNHEQIILKNEDGVYVLTPSLNKSFKFQSEWPYNNSQCYILQNLIKDIEKDKTKKITEKNKSTVITTNVNYSNNQNMKKQKIYLKNSKLEKVEVYDKDNNVKIKMIFEDIDLKAKFKKDYFNLNNNIKTSNTVKTMNELDEIMYPMYIPEKTYLASEEKVKTQNKERAILTFAGEKPFTIIEEPAEVSKYISTINMYGEPTLLSDTIGSLGNNSASWISNGIEYYATSSVMSEEELALVAKSINTSTITKIK